MKLSQSAKERQPCANDNKKVKLHSPPFVPKRNFTNASWSRTGVATRKDLCTDRCKHESLSIPQLCWEVLFQSIASCCGLSLPVWKLRFSIWTILESSCRLSLMRRCQSLPVKDFLWFLSPPYNASKHIDRRLSMARQNARTPIEISVSFVFFVLLSTTLQIVWLIYYNVLNKYVFAKIVITEAFLRYFTSEVVVFKQQFLFRGSRIARLALLKCADEILWISSSKITSNF